MSVICKLVGSIFYPPCYDILALERRKPGLEAKTGMSARGELTVTFDVKVSLDDRNDYWAARIEPLGMIVYGRSLPEVEQRVEDGVRFFLESTPDIRQYLDYHGVAYHVKPEAIDDQGTFPMVRTYPLSVKVEASAYA